MAAVGGFEQASPTYDDFVTAYHRLSTSTEDIQLLRSLQPTEPERISALLLTAPKSTSISIFYDTIIALGLAACNASSSALSNFTAQDHYNAMMQSSFMGTSGRIRLNEETGTRDPKSARFVLTNFVSEAEESGGSVDSDTVRVTSVLSNFYSGGQWTQVEPFIFNDGTPVAPSDLPPVEMNNNYIGVALRAVGLSLAACILSIAIACAAWTYSFRKLRVVKSSQPVFLQLICLGCFTLGAAIIPLSIDDEHSSTAGCSIACMSFPWLASCGFCIAFSALVRLSVWL